MPLEDLIDLGYPRGPLYGEMSAAAVMVMLPNIVMTLALQRYLVRGLTLGAVKG